jgi:cytohesin
LETRHPKTLEWIWKTKEFVGWLKSSGSNILHLEGKPASGKSVMAKYVAGDLKGRWGNYRGEVLAKYFFNGADPEYSNHRMMLQSVLCSILSQAPHFFYQFRKIYRKHKDAINRDGWDLEWLQSILDNCKRHPIHTRIYLVIDGLDESINYQEAGQVLNSLVGKASWVMKIFVTSRAHEKASSFLGDSSRIVLELANTTDITKYTASFLKEEFKKYQDTIVKLSGNIFLWVRLVEAQVRRYREAEARWSTAQFDEFLLGLHPRLSELYGSLFQRLQSSNNEDFVRECRHMFQLVLAACRPLSASEFNDALSILYKRDKIMSQDFLLSDWRQNTLRTWIVKHTVNFIELHGPTGENGMTCTALHAPFLSLTQSSGDIEFLHQSAREFFLEPYGDLNPNSGLAILWDRVAGHNTLTNACVNCVCYFLTHVNSVVDFTSPGEFWMEGSWSTFVNYLDDLPLLPYCIDHLKHHLKKSEMEPQDWKRLHEAFRSPAARLLATWLDRLDDYMPPRKNHPLSDDQVQNIKNHLLHEAAGECKGIAVKVLLQLGAEVNSRSPSKRNESALNLALSSYGRPGDQVAGVVDTLLKHGADLTTRTFYGGIPLHYAAGRGHMQAVHQLLAKSIDLEVLDKDQMTPLHRAVINGRDDVARRLIEAGARVHVADANGLKPIHWAASKGHLSCVELLLKNKADINDRCNSLTVPLHWACGRGHEDVVRYLVENGANIKNYDRLKKTALRWAARYGHVSIVKYLLRKGLNVNWEESSGRTALHWAAQKGHLEVVRILLEAGADVKVTELHGTDALSWAVTYGHIEIVRLLLRHRADAFRKDNGGRTLLHWSAAKGRVGVLEVLLKTGLNPNWADVRGHTPLSLATRYNHKDIVEILLTHGADPNFAGEGRRVPLFWAASYGHVEVLHRLIKFGANVNAKNDAGETPLHWAAAKGHDGVISDLINRYRADSNIRDNTGKIYTDCRQEFKEQDEFSDWDQRDSTDDVDDSSVIEPRY